MNLRRLLVLSSALGVILAVFHLLIGIWDRATQPAQLTRAIFDGNSVAVRAQLKRGTVMHTPEGNISSILILAGGDDPGLVRLALDLGADVNSQDKDRNTALMVAASNDRLDMVQLLISRGANVNLANIRGATPLLAAIMSNNHSAGVVKALLKAGANIEARDSQGRSALWYATTSQPDICRILIQSGANVNTCDDHGNTVLMSASEAGNPSLVRRLIEAGVDVHAQDSEGKSALGTLRFTAQESGWRTGYGEVARLLISAGAKE